MLLEIWFGREIPRFHPNLTSQKTWTSKIELHRHLGKGHRPGGNRVVDSNARQDSIYGEPSQFRDTPPEITSQEVHALSLYFS